MTKNNEASASQFGWDFQVNAAICLMAEYFSEFSEITVEGISEDIELKLNDGTTIFAQSKSVQLPADCDSNFYSKLAKSMRSLFTAFANNRSGTKKLIFVTNSLNNPISIVSGGFTLWNYSNLSKEYRDRIASRFTPIENDGQTLYSLMHEDGRDLGFKFAQNEFNKLDFCFIEFNGENDRTRYKHIDVSVDQIFDMIKDQSVRNSKNTILDKWRIYFNVKAGVKANSNKKVVTKQMVIDSIIYGHYQHAANLSEMELERIGIPTTMAEEVIAGVNANFGVGFDMLSENITKIYGAYLKYEIAQGGYVRHCDFVNCEYKKFFNTFGLSEDTDTDHYVLKYLLMRLLSKSAVTNTIRKGLNYENI